MRIFAKKTYELETGDGKIITRPLSFTDVPDDTKKSLMFQLAVADGSIMLIDSDEKQKEAESGDASKPKKRGRAKKESTDGETAGDESGDASKEDETEKSGEGA